MDSCAKLKRLNLPTVREFFLAKGAKDECLSCGAASWTYTGPTDDTHLLLGVPFGFPQESQPTSTLLASLDLMRPSIMMTCNHCGFQRLHDAFIIATWAEERARTPGYKA
jgi:hypothetical protein